MNNRFSGQPNSGFRRRNERERLFFVAAAGLAFSLLIITVVIFNFRTTDADAGQNTGVSVVNNIPQSVGTTTILAAKRPVPEGQKLSDVELTEMYWPMHKVPEGAIRDRSELQNLFAIRNIEAGAPITRAMTTKEMLSGGLPVTPGNRAVTIQVDATTSFEGHMKPGSSVDVTLTFNENGNLTTKVIVQRARVISYGGKTESRQSFIVGDAPRAVYSTATLDVPAQDAMTILTARKLGTLSLLMRAADDRELITKAEVPEGDIVKGSGRNSASGKSAPASRDCGTARLGDGSEVIIPCAPGESLQRLDNR